MKDYWPGGIKIINTSLYLPMNMDSRAGEVSYVVEEMFKAALDGVTILVNDQTPLNCFQAAEFLNVSNSYFKQELEPQLTPIDPQAKWKKYLYKDLAAYAAEREKESDRLMQELVDLDQEMGLYD